jgi:hypothetical protein
MPRVNGDDKRFLPFRIGDLVMVGPRDPNRPNAYTRLRFDKIHVIVQFYMSIAKLRCAYVKPVDDSGETHGLRLNRCTHTLRHAQWEV